MSQCRGLFLEEEWLNCAFHIALNDFWGQRAREDRLSSQSTYAVDIDDKNYIEVLSPNLALFDNEVSSGNKFFKCVYTQLINALNDLRVQKCTKTTLSAVWNGKSVNTYIAQVKAKDVVTDSNNIEFYDWNINNFYGHFWSCHNIERSPMLKLAIWKSNKKSPHHDLSGNLFDLDHGIKEHQFVGFVSSHNKSNLLTSFHLHGFVTLYTD